jgi:hypothetical protein
MDTMMMLGKMRLLLLLSVFAALGSAFVTNAPAHRHGWTLAASEEMFEILIDMPPTRSDAKAKIKCKSKLSVPSELVEVRYKIPFGLDVTPKKGFAVCNKDGPGGERVGDVLRYTSQWTMGLPRGDGLATTAALFAGGVSWQCSMFDVLKAEVWEQVVEALVSNDPGRTDEVVLLFERPLEGTAPELE